MDKESAPQASHPARRSERDHLLDSLIITTKLFDIPRTARGLTNGLPLEEGYLTPRLFERAAERANITAKVCKKSFKDAIEKKPFPKILLLKNRQACVVTETNENEAIIQKLEVNKVVEEKVPLDQLKQQYKDHVILVRPNYRFDSRAKAPNGPPVRRWFWRVMYKAIPVYTEVLLAAFLINVFALASPLFVMNVYNRVIPNNAIETLWVLATGVIIIFVFDFIMRMLRSYFVDSTGRRIDIRLSRSIFEQLMGMRMRDRPDSVGSLASSVQSFEAFREFITSLTVNVLVDVPFVALFIFVIWTIGGKLALVPIIGIPLVVLFGLLMQSPLNNLASKTYRHSAEKQALLIESLGNIEIIKTLRAESVMQTRWEKMHNAAVRVGIKMRMLTNTTLNFSHFIQMLATVVVVMMGVYAIAEGNLTIGGLIACTILTGRSLASISQVAGLMMRYKHATASLNGLDKIMQLPVERPPAKRYLQRARLKGDIEFQQVTFSYPGTAIPAIDNVSLKIHQGEHVAILGRTGSGKSTLLKLILQLYTPSSGRMLMDNTETRQLDPSQIRDCMGYVPQEITLFHGSIRENIAMVTPYIDDQAVIQIAEIAGVMDFVRHHPEGLDRQVGERGHFLSGGQRQAIGLARALLLDPQIILLDEPTNSMDEKLAQQVIDRIKTFAANKTLVIVSHRSQTLPLVDRLLILEQGKVYMDGPKADVITKLKAAGEQRTDQDEKKD